MVTELLTPVKSQLQIINKGSWIPQELTGRLRLYNPKSHLGRIVKDCFNFLPPEQAGELLDAISRTLVIESSLYGKVTYKSGRVEELGLLGNKVITDAGVGFLVDAWQNLVEMEILKYHALGTGTTAEAASGGGAAMVTELTTEYAVSGNRATGTLTESSANIFQTVATNTLAGTPGAALREHGILSTVTGAAVCWDRTLYGAITLSSGDALQTTYNMTATSGG